MTHDGFSSYDRFQDAAHQQCVDHALRRARGLLEKQSGAACIFPRQVIELFTDSLRLRDRLHAAAADDERRGRAYEDYTQRLLDLTKRPRLHEQNARLANHLYNHSASWFLFLIDPLIPATNHRAEQALKTARSGAAIALWKAATPKPSCAPSCKPVRTSPSTFSATSVTPFAAWLVPSSLDHTMVTLNNHPFFNAARTGSEARPTRL